MRWISRWDLVSIFFSIYNIHHCFLLSNNEKHTTLFGRLLPIKFIYLNTRFTAANLWFHRFSHNLGRFPTKISRSGRVPIIRYIKFPMTSWYWSDVYFIFHRVIIVDPRNLCDTSACLLGDCRTYRNFPGIHSSILSEIVIAEDRIYLYGPLFLTRNTVHSRISVIFTRLLKSLFIQ